MKFCMLVAIGAAIVGCGSSSSSSTSAGGTATSAAATSAQSGSSSGTTAAQLAAAKAAVAQASAPITTWKGPTSAPTPAKNKFVVAIPCSDAAAGCKRPMDAFQQAAHLLGWKTLNIDPQGNLQMWKAAFATAIRLHANGIATIGGTTPVFAQQLAAAKKAGVTVINVSGAKVDGPPAWFANIYQNNYNEGILEAAFLTAQSGGKANILLTTDSEYDSILEWRTGFLAGLKKYCSGCKVITEIRYTLEDFQTTLPQKVQAALEAHPNINWIWGSYDAGSVPVVQAVQQAGLTGKVQLVSVNGDPENLGFIAKGQVESGTVANCLEWEGYAAVDELNRAFNNQPEDPNEFYGSKLITKANLPQPSGQPWDCDIDFRAQYKKIWGLGS
ncbi:MAG TPA: sugar ABC transporter substrate-binding protein [Solirubrobacteraceae bacterium]